MKIAIAVHGRFHSFDLARELIRAGCDVTIFTNYPRYVVERFGIPRHNVINNVTHGVVSRIAQRAHEVIGPIFEPFIHRWFGNWVRRQLRSRSFDVVHGFSGICEELFRARNGPRPVCTLVRGSAHIEEQYQLLLEEQSRSGVAGELPSEWMRAREQREYTLADQIVVLSSYAHESFRRNGFPNDRLRVLRLGAELKRFRPSQSVIEQRCERISRGLPLRVLTVGTFSAQKGALDYVYVARELTPKCEFRFVGTVVPQVKKLHKEARGYIEFFPRVGQHDLPRHYDWADVFLFQTIHDGYAVVLAQAAAAGLPILSTANCAAPDLVRDSVTGWVFPIREPWLFVDGLQWCHDNRDGLAEMVRKTFEQFAPRDWSRVAADFIAICSDLTRR